VPVSPRTRRLNAMLLISKQIDYHFSQEQFLKPRYGEIMAGSQDFDHLLKMTVRLAYLRVLRRGGTPEEAHKEAVQDGNDCVAKWNANTHKTRAYVSYPGEMKRWDKAGEAEADSLHLHFLSLLK
jgi:hypothetical protein